jgi:hypothetical protein
MPGEMHDFSRDGWLTELVVNNLNFWLDPTAGIRQGLVLAMVDAKTLKAL